VRHRTRRHRRNRLIRRILVALVFILGGLTGAVLLPIDFSSFLASSFSTRSAAEWSDRGDVRRDLALSAAGSDSPSKDVRPVYPYSIVPGGIHDPKELERAVEKDPVIAAHYRGFDFRRARVVQLAERIAHLHGVAQRFAHGQPAFSDAFGECLSHQGPPD